MTCKFSAFDEAPEKECYISKRGRTNGKNWYTDLIFSDLQIEHALKFTNVIGVHKKM